MAVLKAARRKRLPKKSFGLPKGAGKTKKARAQNQYPMPDKRHAANAKARATQQLKKGRITKSQKARIDAMANRKLGKKAGGRKKTAGRKRKASPRKRRR
jgi:hypothetical protein